MKSLIQQIALWLMDLRVRSGCTGVFLKVNFLDPSFLCDRCLRGVLSLKEEKTPQLNRASSHVFASTLTVSQRSVCNG